MTAIEQTILTALLDLEAAISQLRTTQPKPDLQSSFARIDHLAGQLPRSADPTLLHYLHKKSYQKARLYLQGRDAENDVGACRHDSR